MKSRLLLVAVLILTPLLLAAQGEASLTVTVVGNEVTIDGAGFDKNRLIELRFFDPTVLEVATVPVTSDRDGVFTVVVVLEDSRIVEAWQQQGNHFVLKAQATITVSD